MEARTNHVADGVRIAVDIGGTFTDGVAFFEDAKRIWVGKTLTTPDDPGRAVTTIVQDLLRQLKASDASMSNSIAEVVHGTTLVTNTLIERKGVDTLLVSTEGFRDTLEIGREWRYDLYDLELQRPDPLVGRDRHVEVSARMSAEGEVLTALSEADIKNVARAIEASGARSVAISLLHSYVNREHEINLVEQLSQAFRDISFTASSDLASEIKEYERASTTTASAYVKPIVANYLQQLGSRVDDIQCGVPLRIMVSSGGFTSAATAADAPIYLLESGPAAGVLSAINTAAAHDRQNVLAFDMGGTTAKACVVTSLEAPVAYSFECARVHRFKRGSGLPILIPSIDLIEIGAGGGSIAHVNHLGLLNVGPESAGSVPGPVCYGLGGKEPTVTDADLLLGYLNPANFLGGEMQLRKDLALEAMGRLAQRLGMGPLQVAWGIHNMVNENMASAARIHIAEKGYDPRDFTMVATGGAGPVHAAEVARKLRIPKLLASIAAGAGSCLGMLAAPARADRSWSQPTLLADADWDSVRERYSGLRSDAMRELARAGVEEAKTQWMLGAEMRYHGQGDNVPISVPYHALDDNPARHFLAGFEAQYKRLYGHLVPNARPQVMTWRLVGQSVTGAKSFGWGDTRGAMASEREERGIYLPMKECFGKAAVYDRYGLPIGTKLSGPAVLEERESTLVIPFDADIEIMADLSVSITIKEF